MSHSIGTKRFIIVSAGKLTVPGSMWSTKAKLDLIAMETADTRNKHPNTKHALKTWQR